MAKLPQATKFKAIDAELVATLVKSSVGDEHKEAKRRLSEKVKKAGKSLGFRLSDGEILVAVFMGTNSHVKFDIIKPE